MRGHLIATTVWIALIGAGYLAFEHFDRSQETVSTCTATEGRDEMRIPVSRDGHFYVDGAVNGVPVRLMVDTGASYVTVGEADAGRARVKGGSPAMFNTANGQVSGRIARQQRVRVGCFESSDVSVAVSPGLDGVGLLGQNWLKRFEVVQTREELRLRAR